MKKLLRQISIFLLLAFCAAGLFVGCTPESEEPYFHTEMQEIELEVGEKQSVTYTSKNTVVSIHIEDENVAKLVDNNSFVQGVSAGESKLVFENGKQETLFEVVVKVVEKQGEGGSNVPDVNDGQNDGDGEQSGNKDPLPSAGFFAEFVEVEMSNGRIDGDKIVLFQKMATITFLQSGKCQEQNMTFRIVSAKIVCGAEETNLDIFENPLILPTSTSNYVLTFKFEFVKTNADGTATRNTVEKSFAVSVEIE